ncbi:MAG: PKD domain-containing protein [Microthrixaceae bacterium]
MTDAPSGVVFPPSYVKLNHPVDGSVAIISVDLLPTAAATGTLNPLTGQMVLNVKLRAKLSGDLWGNSVSSDCSIGTAGNPIAVRFTTDKLPSINGGPALSGSKYDPAGGTAMLVSNDFYVPGASGYLAGGWLDINDTINQATKLPSQVGKNLATLSGKITPIIGAGVTANLGHDPLVLTGDAPVLGGFQQHWFLSGEGSCHLLVGLRRWRNLDRGGNPVHVFTAAGLHTTTLTVTDADGDSVSKSVKVTVNGGTVNQIPVARVTTNPTPATGNAPLAVGFDGSTSTVGDGPGTYEWTFGDGTSATRSLHFAHLCERRYLYRDAEGDRQQR